MTIENISYMFMDKLSDIVCIGILAVGITITALLCVFLISKNKTIVSTITFVMLSIGIFIGIEETKEYINSHRKDMYNHYIVYERLYNTVIVSSNDGYVAIDLKNKNTIPSNYMSYIVFKECKNFEIYRTNVVIEYNFDYNTLRSKYREKGIAFCIYPDKT